MPKLIYKNGERPPVALDDGQPLTVGRLPENRLHLAHGFISSRHAVLRCEDDCWWIEDLGSSNGTFVNGHRLTGRQLLQHGDEIEFAKLAFGFEYERPDFEAATVILKAPVSLPAPPAPAAARPASSPPVPAVPAGGLTAAKASPVSAPPLTVPAAPTDVGLLDQLVGSIRSHRERERQEREARQAALKAQWEITLRYAEDLQKKLQGDPRIRYFAVSRRNNEIMIRYQRTATATPQFLLISLQHPDQPDHALTGIWMRRSGEPDRCFESADSAAIELVQEMAFLLA